MICCPVCDSDTLDVLAAANVLRYRIACNRYTDAPTPEPISYIYICRACGKIGTLSPERWTREGVTFKPSMPQVDKKAPAWGAFSAAYKQLVYRYWVDSAGRLYTGSRQLLVNSGGHDSKTVASTFAHSALCRRTRRENLRGVVYTFDPSFPWLK